jgi:hypothetical protein
VVTARKSPIGSTNYQWGMKELPLMEVSLYMEITLEYIPIIRYNK